MIRWICVLLAFWVATSQAQECRQSPRMHALDFWIGRWDVSQGGQPVGTNTIESTLDGCAILEHWRDVEGGEGTSLFYYDQSANAWKQVWITDHALRLGGTKEKIEQKEYTTSSRIRFQGIDRTTLTREADGKVRQLIETPPRTARHGARPSTPSTSPAHRSPAPLAAKRRKQSPPRRGC